MTIEFKGIFGFVFWCMLGLLSYLVIGDYTTFSWIDPWLYIYMLFWPAIWVWFFFVWFLIIGVICVIVAFVLIVLERFNGSNYPSFRRFTRRFNRRNRR